MTQENYLWGQLVKNDCPEHLALFIKKHIVKPLEWQPVKKGSCSVIYSNSFYDIRKLSDSVFTLSNKTTIGSYESLEACQAAADQLHKEYVLSLLNL